MSGSGLLLLTAACCLLVAVASSSAPQPPQPPPMPPHAMRRLASAAAAASPDADNWIPQPWLQQLQRYADSADSGDELDDGDIGNIGSNNNNNNNNNNNIDDEDSAAEQQGLQMLALRSQFGAIGQPYAAQQKRSCLRRGGACDYRPRDCCGHSSCRCNLWGQNCRCQRMGLFQKWG